MNLSKRFYSRAPANLMLMGEHAVVHGYPALACAIDQWIQIEWQCLPKSTQVQIHSDLAHHTTDWQTWEIHPQLQFVQAALATARQTLQPQKIGLKLTIQSEFASTLGLGSSAAVLAATLSGLYAITQPEKALTTACKQQLFQTGLKIIHQIQKRGSGTDLAASLFGGLIYFEPNRAKITPLPLSQPLPLTLIYSGYKTPTAEVLQTVNQQWQTEPKLLQQLYQLMGETTQAANQAWQTGDRQRFDHLVNAYQGLMDALGVNDATLSQIVYQLRETLPASKISGSGLGDCVLGFGELSPTLHSKFSTPMQVFSPKISPIGCHLK
ncbi:mevalonate kinase [Galenea microaerophila]